jgi:hypothetical protein
VKIPSRIILNSLLLVFATSLARKSPKKKVTSMETEAVFREIRTGEKSVKSSFPGLTVLKGKKSSENRSFQRFP